MAGKGNNPKVPEIKTVISCWNLLEFDMEKYEQRPLSFAMPALIIWKL